MNLASVLFLVLDFAKGKKKLKHPETKFLPFSVVGTVSVFVKRGRETE